MGNNFTASVTMDLIDRVSSNGNRMSKNLGRYTKRMKRDLRSLKKTANKTGKALAKLGNNRMLQLGGGLGVGAAVNYLGDMEERMVRLGIQAGKSTEEMRILQDLVFNTAQMPDIRVNPSQILDAIDKIVEKTGDLDYATANLRNIGLTMQATDSQGNDVGALLAEFKKLGVKDEAEALKWLDILTEQGKKGAFTLANFSSQGERIVAATAAAGYKGEDSVRMMGAMLQRIRPAVGSAEMTATAYEALLKTISEKQDQFKAAGIDVKDGKNYRPVTDIVEELVVKAEGNDAILRKFFDAEAFRAVAATLSEYNRTKKVSKADEFMNVQADGSAIKQDSSRAAQTQNAAQSVFSTDVKSVMDVLTAPVSAITESYTGMSDSTRKNTIATTAGLLGVAGAAAAIDKVATKMGKSTNLLKGLKTLGKGAGRIVPGVAPLMSIYEIQDAHRNGTNKDVAGAYGGATGAVATGLAGAAIGSVVPVVGTIAGGVIGSIIGYFGGKQIGRSVVDNEVAPTQVPEGKILIEVLSDTPLNVTKSKVLGLDIQVDTGHSMRGAL